MARGHQHGNGDGTGQAPKGGPNQVDVHVGQRVRTRRKLLGMSQQRLAEEIGVAFQQLQKYEGGKNRVDATRLIQLSHILDVPISFFFDQMDAETTQSVEVNSKPEVPRELSDRELLSRPETLELVRAYRRISDDDTRRLVLQLVKVLGSDSSDDT